MLNGALPVFGLDQSGVRLALVRGVTVASLLSLFGALVFRSVVMPSALRGLPALEAAALTVPLRRWTSLTLGVALACLLIWVPLQSGAMAGASTQAGVAAAVPTVLAGTSFGHLVALQLACVLATAWAVGSGARVQLAMGLAGLALALHAGHTHALAMEPGPSLLLASDIVHLLAGGVWLGGLVPLWLMVRLAPPRIGAAMCRFYSPLGKWCLVAVLATASIQFWQLIGGIAGLAGTAYGWMAMGKITLFGLLFGFALMNRYRLAPALLGPDPEPSRRALERSIGLQTGMALAVVLVAGVLSQLSPAIHLEPIWPFSGQFSLVSVREDPDFRDEVLRALVMLGGAVALLVAGIRWWRRWFGWLALAASILLAVPAVPHLGLLVIPATPTSFYQSPTGFSAETITAGRPLYNQHCAACHGTEGRGDGPHAVGLSVPPVDLTAPHLWDHADGELFWWLSHGIEAPEGGLAMPGFSASLGDDEIWALIDFIRARNAGVAHAAGAAWASPVAAPGFQMRCASGTIQDLAALRGRIVRLVFGPRANDEPGLWTVLADPAAQPVGDRQCGTTEGEIRTAYAVVSGVPEDTLAGATVLIDADGWLRALHHPDDPAGDAAWLAAALNGIQNNTLVAPASGAFHHHH